MFFPSFHLSAWSRCVLAIATVAAFSSCTLKSKDKASVRIVLPNMEAAARSHARLGNAGGNLLAAPSALGDFNCFGVQVTGPAIVPDPRLGCGGFDPEVHGIIAGLVPSTGGEIELLVPAGPRRVVQVFGIQGPSGCPSIDSLLALPAGTRFDGVGKPYPLGSGTVDIFQDTTVQISASFVAGATPLFAQCGYTPGGAVANGMDFGGLVEATAPTCNSGVGRPCLTARLGFTPFGIPGGLTPPPAGNPRYDLQFGHFYMEP